MSDSTDTTDEPLPEAAPAAPGRPMFSGWQFSNVPQQQRYLLTGPDTPELSTLLASLVLGRMGVRCSRPRARYLVWGRLDMAQRFEKLIFDEPGATAAGFAFGPEPIPDEAWLSSEPVRAAGWRRTTEVQGQFGHMREWIARAIDYRLTPSYLGAGRWAVTGPTALQMRWIAEVVLRKPLADVMAELCVTPDLMRREDLDGQPVALSSLPRESITKVQTDDDGNIVQSRTYEFDAAG